MRYIERTLLSNVAATGSGVNWPGGRGTFTAEGTFSGATVALQMKTVQGSWVAVALPNSTTACAMTAAGAQTFELPPCEIRAAVSGGTPSALYAFAQTNDAAA